ncbi:acyl-CoA synthetase (AMP-forming)/AMP-acid ligase II [Rhodococcus sp. 27YEA15]|uniref:class I adenylate-forming enzyme family protein n=1 Tax=Rhodococcus sp. 27YEA15 TaxID=3156259 RepID=UPI003C7A7487
MKYEAGLLARRAAQSYPDRIALTYEDSDITFREVNATANRFGSGLARLGLGKGDRVAVLSWNRPEVVYTWLGCEKFGLVRVGMHTHNPLQHHIDLLRHVGAAALVFDTAFKDDVSEIRTQLPDSTVFIGLGDECPSWAIPFARSLISGSPEDPRIDVDEDDPCFMQLTSGTTGMSKPWVKSYRSWLAVINQNAIHLDTFDDQPAIDKHDVNLHFHPLQWATGFQTFYPYFIRGARTVLLSDADFDADVVLDTLLKEQVTGSFAPGPLLSPILDAIERRADVNLSIKRLVVFFATPELLTRTTRLIGAVWAHAFGSTEQGAAATRLLPSDVTPDCPRRLDSVGRPASFNFEVAVVDSDGQQLPSNHVGEIVVRSAMSIGYYWGFPEATEAAFLKNNWFRSGDVGQLDEDGFLYYGDRAVDTIEIGDDVIYPHVVEASLLAHESVSNCGVVRVEQGGRATVVAAVCLKDGVDTDSRIRETLQTLSASALPGLSVGVEILFVETLPTVLGGAKVQRNVLRETIEAQR